MGHTEEDGSGLGQLPLHPSSLSASPRRDSVSLASKLLKTSVYHNINLKHKQYTRLPDFRPQPLCLLCSQQSNTTPEHAQKIATSFTGAQWIHLDSKTRQLLEYQEKRRAPYEDTEEEGFPGTRNDLRTVTITSPFSCSALRLQELGARRIQQTRTEVKAQAIILDIRLCVQWQVIWTRLNWSSVSLRFNWVMC